MAAADLARTPVEYVCPDAVAGWAALQAATLDATAGAAVSATPPPPNRATVTDDGHRIRIAVYSAGLPEPLGVVELSPEAAARLAADLIGAAAAHMAAERNHRVGVIRGPAE